MFLINKDVFAFTQLICALIIILNYFINAFIFSYLEQKIFSVIFKLAITTQV